MTKLYQDFQYFLKNRPRFNINYITIECPEFIVKFLLGKHYKDQNNDFFLEQILRKTD
jgi:hypothetical protein